MRPHPVSLLLRPTPPPLALGIVVAVAFIAGETLVVYPLRQVAREVSLGVVYLLGVLVVAIVWGAALGVATSVASAAAFDFFHVPPSFGFVPADPQDLVALAIFLAVALLLTSVAEMARSRAIEADERRRESDLAAEMARLLLRADDLRSALPEASRRVARALGLADAAIELRVVAGDQRRAAFPLRDGATALGTLLVPADLPEGVEDRLRERVVPSVEALLHAAREREAMGGALEASRDELRLLAEEQAALRRVATLVAHAVSPTDVFGVVVTEVAGLLGADLTMLLRYEPDDTFVVVGVKAETFEDIPLGTRAPTAGGTIVAAVLRTGRPARIDNFEGLAAPGADRARELGLGSAVGIPVVVEDRLWGVMLAGWAQGERLPTGIEERMAQFTELVATAIANADSRAELAASRARVVVTADETRRRIERDLHDGAQQRLVHTVVTLKLARRALGEVSGPAADLVGEALSHAERANAEIRELAHGILPAALRHGGLRAGTESLLSRVRLPISVDVTAERLPPAVEATAYFVVAEALTNAVKHAHATSAQVTAFVDSGALHVEVRDDGIGGAQLQNSSGLLGLHDRAAALGGTLTVESPPGGGTTVIATLPVPDS